MNAPPWPTNPNVGDWFANWVWSGSQWVATPTTGMRVVTQVFGGTGSYTYMPSLGLVSLVVECVGAGGGGGGAIASANLASSPGWMGGGGGGGSGGYSRKTLPAALVRGGVPVTLGANGFHGGLDGFAGNGESSSFGALCVAYGGFGGQAGNPGTGSYGQAGNGAGPGIGDIAAPGNAGMFGLSFYYDGTRPGVAFGGAGGVSFLGGAPRNVMASTNELYIVNGMNGGDWGSGGGGAVSGTSTEPASGGFGGYPVCVITEYCWGDVDQPSVRPPLDVNVHWPRPPFPGGGPWPPGPWPRSEDDP